MATGQYHTSDQRAPSPKRTFEEAKGIRSQAKEEQKHTEPGNDDCGDDISGLGKDAILLKHDAWVRVSVHTGIIVWLSALTLTLLGCINGRCVASICCGVAHDIC